MSLSAVQWFLCVTSWALIARKLVVSRPGRSAPSVAEFAVTGPAPVPEERADVSPRTSAEALSIGSEEAPPEAVAGRAESCSEVPAPQAETPSTPQHGPLAQQAHREMTAANLRARSILVNAQAEAEHLLDQARHEAAEIPTESTLPLGADAARSHVFGVRAGRLTGLDHGRQKAAGELEELFGQVVDLLRSPGPRMVVREAPSHPSDLRPAGRGQSTTSARSSDKMTTSPQRGELPQVPNGPGAARLAGVPAIGPARSAAVRGKA